MAIFFRLLGFLRFYCCGVVLSVLLAVAVMVMTVAIFAFIGVVVDVIDDGDRDGLVMVGVLVVAVGVVRWVLSFAWRLIVGCVLLGVEVDLRERVYGYFQAFELGFFDCQQIGQFMLRLMVDLQFVCFFFGYGFVFILQFALTIVFIAIVMLVINLGFVVLVLFFVLFVVYVVQCYGCCACFAFQEVQQWIVELTADVEEDIGGVRVVKVFVQEDCCYCSFERMVARVFDQLMLFMRLWVFYNLFIVFFLQIGLALLLLVGGCQVIDGKLSFGEFIVFYTYVLYFFGLMRLFGMSLGFVQCATVSGARLFELFDCELWIVSAADVGLLPVGSGRVEFDHVMLVYDLDRDLLEFALRDVLFIVEVGMTLVLVGAIGSGKMTFVQLFLWLYDLIDGSVWIDGADVCLVDLCDLCRVVVYVNDDLFLFSVLVAENIVYVWSDASYEEVERAVCCAQVYGFIERLFDGYVICVGERGFMLSGGQRQWIAIVCALFVDLRIFVFDDVIFFVDVLIEQAIKEVLREVMVGRIMFIIVYCLLTIVLADEIVVLEGGAFVCYGIHDELFEHNDFYCEIVEKGLFDQVFFICKLVESEVAGL